MRIGYLVADADGVAEERTSLSTAGCERVMAATPSGVRTLWAVCQPGDTVVVWTLDRLGLSLSAVVRAMAELAQRGVGVSSLREGLDSDKATVAEVLTVLLAWEQGRVRQRSQAGREVARTLKKLGGRPPGLDERKRQAVLALKQERGDLSVHGICQAVGVSRNTYYKYLRSQEGQTPPPAGPPPPRVMRVRLYLQVENNSKFVRGRSRSLHDIEAEILSRYGMEKPDPDSPVYILSIPYHTDEELDQVIYQDIYAEAERIADRRNGFIEADVTSLDDPDRSW